MGRNRKEREDRRSTLSRDDQEYFRTIDIVQEKRRLMGIKVDSRRFMKEFAPRQWNPDFVKVTPLEMKRRKNDDAVDKAFELFYASGCTMKKTELAELSGSNMKAMEYAFSKAGINFNRNSDRDLLVNE